MPMYRLKRHDQKKHKLSEPGALIIKLNNFSKLLCGNIIAYKLFCHVDLRFYGNRDFKGCLTQTVI